MEADTSVSIYTLVKKEDFDDQGGNVNKNIYFTINDGIRHEYLAEDSSSYIVQDDEVVYQLDSTAIFNSNLKILTLNNEKFLCITASEEENVESIEPHLISNQNIVQLKQKFTGDSEELVSNIETEGTQIGTSINMEPYEMIMYDDITASNIIVNSSKKIKCLYKNSDKIYSTSQHLNVHNVNSKPYSCTFEGCEKNFSTNYSLKAHLRTHTGEKPYTCQVCFKSFKTSGDLQKHIRTHTGEKPFSCPVLGCGKSFTTSNIRKVHIRSHTGERPYICDYPNCGKSFASSTNYKNHARIHSGEKPYACTVKDCGKRFTEYSSFYKHQVVHQVDKPHKCSYCKQSFKSEHALNIHKRVKHGILAPDNICIEMKLGA